MTAACPRCGHTEGLATAEWSFFIPLEPPTQNVVAMNKGGKRFGYKRIRETFGFLFAAKRNELGIPDATGKRRVTLTRLYTGRGKERDYGNLVGGMKVVTDAMTRARLIVDDSPKWLDDYYQQRRDEKLSGVEVMIQEME